MINAIIAGCGDKAKQHIIKTPPQTGGGGGGYLGRWYSMWAFVGWVNSITVGGYDDEGPWQPAPTTPPKLKFANKIEFTLGQDGVCEEVVI